MQIAELFYTQSQVAKVLDVSRTTVWRWIKQGRFDVQRAGGVVFIPKQEVELIRTKGKNVRRKHK